MNKMDIVITMGGVGSRFKKAGFDKPKYMIEAKGKTLFEWSLISLSNFKEYANQYIFIALKDNNSDIEAFISQKCKSMNIEKFHTIIIDKLTDGQATTAMIAEKYWNSENPLFVYNIDTYIEPDGMNFYDIKGDGFIPCFVGEGNHWSFVKTDENGVATEVKEKERISDNCSIGGYYFKTCSLYKKLYNEYYKDSQNTINGEKYIAPLYNLLINQGGKIYISKISAEKVHVLGTPEELEIFIKN